MMRSISAKLAIPAAIAAAAFLALVGCTKPAPTPEVQAKALADRATTLAPKLANADAVLEFDKLVADVQAYGKATGRTDITAERGVVVMRGGAATGGFAGFSARLNNGGGEMCRDHSCPTTPSNAPAGYICRLDGGHCDENGAWCSYRCVKLTVSANPS